MFFSLGYKKIANFYKVTISAQCFRILFLPRLTALRVCLKIAFGKLCVALYGRFGPDEGGVAGNVDRIGAKYTAKWDVHIVGMNFLTHSSALPARKSRPNTDHQTVPPDLRYHWPLPALPHRPEFPVCCSRLRPEIHLYIG